MSSKRKLEEEIARTKDSVLRKQLQELLDKRSQRTEERKRKTKKLLKELWESEPSPTPWWMWLYIVLVFLVLIIFFIKLFSDILSSSRY